MKLNSLESALMNNPVRAASQWWIESPVLIGRRGALAGKRVLEIGCGRGVGIEILLALGAAHVTGFDLDPQMVALAQKRVAKYGDRARVFVGDAEAIDAPDASFDAGVDYGIIHHIPNWRRALKEIVRVLKPGGMFCFEDLLKGFISACPIRALFDHPQATQFYGSEFRAGHMNLPAPSNEPETRTACGGRISDPDRYPSALHCGQRVYFCTHACLRAFESDPDRFMAGEIEHPTEDE